MIASRILAAAAIVLIVASPVAAQELRIGTKVLTTSVDPHRLSSAPNNGFNHDIYDGLINPGPRYEHLPFTR